MAIGCGWGGGLESRPELRSPCPLRCVAVQVTFPLSLCGQRTGRHGENHLTWIS